MNLLYRPKNISYPASASGSSVDKAKFKVEWKITLAMKLVEEAARRGLSVRAVVFEAAYWRMNSQEFSS